MIGGETVPSVSTKQAANLRQRGRTTTAGTECVVTPSPIPRAVEVDMRDGQEGQKIDKVKRRTKFKEWDFRPTRGR